MPAFPPSRTRHRFARGLTSCLLWLLLAAGALFPGHAGAIETLNVRIHLHIDSNDYSGWGLYVWGAGLVLPHSVSWYRPLEASGVDAYGVYFDVGVEPTLKTFNFIAHRGEIKSTPNDLAVDTAKQEREVWVREGTDTVYASAPAVNTPFLVGLEVERQHRQSLQWMAGGTVATLVLLVLGWRLVGRRLARTREQLAANVQMLVQAHNDLRAQGERLQGLGTDELTGLPTRGGLQQALEQALARATRNDHAVAVMFIDLDGFKQVNDTGGHDAGDEVLRTVARRLRGAVRECDFVARVGGDEFVVIVEAVASPIQAFHVGRKLVRAAAEEIIVAGHAHRVGASIGIAMSPGDGSDAAALLKAADNAMYDTKRAGKGTCRFVTAQRQAELERQLALEEALQRSLDKDELTLALEPVVEFASGRVVGHKATLQWSPDGQALPVQAVVEQSDNAALARQVDRWLMTRACRAVGRERTAGQSPSFVSMMLATAAGDLVELPSLVRDVLAEEGLPPQRLLLLFPARRLGEQQSTLDALIRLRGHGVRIGFTGIYEADIGLQRLVMGPIDQLEIDVRSEGGLQRGTPYVRALVAFGLQMGYAVSAVGLGTAAQRRWAEAAGCTLGAGAACETIGA